MRTQNKSNELRAKAMVTYLITSNPRKARALLYSAGYPQPKDAAQMQSYFLDWLVTDRKDALAKIMQNHPDKNLMEAVNELDEKADTDPSFPLPNNFATKSDTYFDHLIYGQNYPYTPEVLADHAYPRPYWQQYRQAMLSGFANYGGNRPRMMAYSGKEESSTDIKNLVLLVIGLVVLYGFLSR